jgi:AbrB family looped-hinge helix DNA binding protein
LTLKYYFYYNYYVMKFPKPKLLAIAQLNEKSQLVIPKEARDEIGIGPGDRVVVALAPFGKALVIAKPESLEEQLKKMMMVQQSTKDEIMNDLTELKDNQENNS